MVWTSSLEGYAKNTCSRWLPSFKQLDQSIELEDLLQDSYVIFLETLEDFQPKSIQGRDKELMAYYKIRLRNSFVDRLRVVKRRNVLIQGEDENRNETFIEESGNFSILLREAPKEVKEVLDIFFNAPSEMLEAIGFGGKWSQISNNKLCRLIGVPRQDLKEKIRNFFIPTYN